MALFGSLLDYALTGSWVGLDHLRSVYFAGLAGTICCDIGSVSLVRRPAGCAQEEHSPSRALLIPQTARLHQRVIRCDESVLMSPHSSIAHYRITSELGAGGMGTVYRATDTKLNRDVAIKVLPDAFAADPDRMARFTREAQVLASLNHPNIAAIYGVEDRALVMELVEGQALSGPISSEEAIQVVDQLIDALEYAHERGIIHRDLKPENIKLTPDGRVKVLDFGLAKAMAGDLQTVEQTLTMRSTVAGVVMGTPGYMSPEQARAKEVDRRSDIWAFGVVVYELLTGQKLFEGSTLSDTIAAVLTRDPDLAAMPPRFRRMVQRCLVRDPRQRLRDISGARLLLEETAAAPALRRSILPWAVAGVLSIAVVMLGMRIMRQPAESEKPVRRFTILAKSLGGANFSQVAVISPDGKRVAYIDEGKLWVRDLDREHPRAVDGTDGALGPFWSPDSEWLAFAGRNQLWKVAVRGGAPIPLCTAATTYLGGDWSPDGKSLVFSLLSRGLLRVTASGGDPEVVLKLTDAGTAYIRPQFLSKDFGPQAMLVSIGDISAQKTVVVHLDTEKVREISAGTMGFYADSGHLLYYRQDIGAVWAVPVSRELSPQGAPFPVAEGAAIANVSKDGTMVYTESADTVQLVWRDRSGKQVGDAGLSQRGTRTIAISPDGEKVAISSAIDGIWVYDLKRSTRTPITPRSAAIYPKWSPDGRQILYMAGTEILVRPSDGTGTTSVIRRGPQAAAPGDWSRDGKYVIYTWTGNPATGSSDLGLLKRKEDGSGFEGAPYVLSPHEEASPRISPNGKYAAFISNESGRFELFVRSFPEGYGRWPVSVNGATQPRWSRDGKELFYLEGRELMAVPVNTEGTFSAGTAKRLFSTGNQMNDRNSLKYDVSPDGRFLIMEGSEAPVIHVVENWLGAFGPRHADKRE